MSDFDPDRFATTTSTFQVDVVRRLSDGAVLDVFDWLPQQRLGDIHRLRPAQRRAGAEPLFACYCCGLPVFLKAGPKGGHFFAHSHRSDAERAGCIYREDHKLSLAERDRIRYQGQREGKRHLRVKELLARILQADNQFETPRIESTWRTFEDGWRRPDVATSLQGLSIVFEAQVSNTYPQVVAERTDFYAKQRAMLIWIFDHIPKEWRTLHADAFCANNQHLFVVNEECARVSEETGVAHLRVLSMRPDVQCDDENGRPKQLVPSLRKDIRLMPIRALRLDPIAQTASSFDPEKEQRRAKHKILCANVQARETDRIKLLNDLRQRSNGAMAIDSLDTVSSWAATVCAIETCRLGRVVGTNHRLCVEVLNYIYDHHPNFIQHLLDTLDRIGIPHPTDGAKEWNKRVEDFRSGKYSSRGRPFPTPHPGADKLLGRLYPTMQHTNHS